MFRKNKTQETTEKDVSELLMYPTNRGIRGLHLLPPEVFSSPDALLVPAAISPLNDVGPSSTVTCIDFDYSRGYIYWSDSNRGTIARSRRDGKGAKVVVGSTNTKDNTANEISSFAVDWVANNLYWANPKMRLIEASRTNGSFRHVVIEVGLDSPHAVAVDPPRGLLFWADTGKRPSISRSALDGTSAFLVTDTGARGVRDIVLDYESGRLYWYDLTEGKIVRIFYNGRGREVVLESGMTSPLALTYNKGIVYWIDHSGGKGFLKAVHAPESVVGHRGATMTLRDDLGDSSKDIAVFSEGRQRGTNPCAEDNGGCQELCLLDGKRPVCECTKGMVGPDGKKCVDYHGFLVYSSPNSIERVELDGTTDMENVYNGTREPNGEIECVSHDYLSSTIFYSNVHSGMIQAVHFNGTVQRVLVGDVVKVESLVFDALERTLYWVSYGRGIFKMRLNNAEDVPRLAVKLRSGDKPRDIDIDPCDSRRKGMRDSGWRTADGGRDRGGIGGQRGPTPVDKGSTGAVERNRRSGTEGVMPLPWWATPSGEDDVLSPMGLSGKNRNVLTRKTKTHHKLGTVDDPTEQDQLIRGKNDRGGIKQTVAHYWAGKERMVTPRMAKQERVLEEPP
ncbi:hypothetical protein AAG570_007284 [Ranatra chinensis]|uniref:LRP2 EGF-like domain-containing protein n=1 Tax=Ranatra chinensis TaxID=642074 RepID=A0ABD0XVQ5_9HEMI